MYKQHNVCFYCALGRFLLAKRTKMSIQRHLFASHTLRTLSHKGLIGIKYLGPSHEGRSQSLCLLRGTPLFCKIEQFMARSGRKKAILQTVLNMSKRTYCRFYSYAQISFQNFMAVMGYYKKIIRRDT